MSYSSKPSNARETLRREAFDQIEQNGGRELLDEPKISVARLMRIAGVSYAYAVSWLEANNVDQSRLVRGWRSSRNDLTRPIGQFLQK